MKWVCFPKFYSPLANWPWLRISPQSSLNVIYCLILTAWQWLMSFTCIPVQIEPTKTHWGKGSWPFSFERSATFPPQADHVLVDLFSSAAHGGLCGQSSPPTENNMVNFHPHDHHPASTIVSLLPTWSHLPPTSVLREHCKAKPMYYIIHL